MKKIMTSPRDLELIQLTPFTGFVNVDWSIEERTGYSKLLYADFTSSLRTWKSVSRFMFAALVIICGVGFAMGFSFGIAPLGAFILTSFMKMQSAAAGNVSRDVQVMLGRIERWDLTNPIACRQYCTEELPEMFGVMHSVITKISNK